MDCACIYIDPDSTPDFVNPVVVVARRSHKCYECGREIVPGENYECTAGKWAGEFLRFKTCADCLSVREAFFCEGFFMVIFGKRRGAYCPRRRHGFRGLLARFDQGRPR
jgi:hypothetical protein